MISGGTGTGKTTLLNALAATIPDEDRIVLIEETSEIVVAHRPIELQTWPDDDRGSRLVFITRGIGQAEVEGLFAAVAALSREKAP